MSKNVDNVAGDIVAMDEGDFGITRAPKRNFTLVEFPSPGPTLISLLLELEGAEDGTYGVMQ